MSEAEEILLMALCVPSIATLHKGGSIRTTSFFKTCYKPF
jgi:hypothetical protein